MFIQNNAQKGDKMRSNILIVITQIFALLDAVKYTIKSGDRPEFFIRVNDVGSLEKMNDNYFQSPTLTKLFDLHNSSMTIMDYFFKHLNNDKDRWELIEKYFLGEDIIKVISDTLN